MKKWVAYLEIFIIFILPVVLITLRIIPLEYRRWLLLTSLIMILFSIWREREKWSWKRLGFRTDNLKQVALIYGLGTLVGVITVFVLAKILGLEPVSDWYMQSHFQFAFILVSIVQEFAYRGYLVPKLKELFSSEWIQVILNAVLFSFLHSFFPYPLLMLPLTFLVGLAFVLVYKKYPNLYLAIIAHSVLNFFAVLYCFVSLSQTC